MEGKGLSPKLERTGAHKTGALGREDGEEVRTQVEEDEEAGEVV